MANDLTGALQARLGPAPVWMWLAAGGLGFWLITRSGLLGGKKSTIPITAPPSGTVPPGFAPFSSGPQPAAPPKTPNVTLSGLYGVVWLHSVPGTAGVVAVLSNGTRLPSAGSPVAGDSYTQGTLTSNLWQPVQYSGTTAYAWAPEAQSIPGGGAGYDSVGGGRVAAGRSPTRRSDTHWSWAGHPLLKQQADYPHYVVGGQGGSSVHGVARSAGLHPARLMAANPHLHGPRGGFTDNLVTPMSGRGIPTSRGYALAVGGPEDALGGFTDNMSQPVARQGQPTSRGRRLVRGGADDDSGQGGSVWARLRGRRRGGSDDDSGQGGPDDALGGPPWAAWPTETYAVGGPEDMGTGGPRGPRLPPGHVARAGQLIRVR